MIILIRFITGFGGGPGADGLLQETGEYLLQEDSSYILL